MKKQIVLVTLIFIIVLAPILALTDSPTKLVDPGTTPDSALYFLDLAMENLGLALTFDNGARIEKELKIAEERLSEVREMALENNLEAMAKAKEKHGEILIKLKEEIKKISANDTKQELKKELQFEKEVNDYETKIKMVQDELKIEINIKGGISSEQQKLIDSILSSLKGQTGEIEIEINNEKGKTKIKIKDETGEDGEKVEDELRVELEIEDDNKIEIEVENNVAKVEVEINDTKQKFKLQINSSQSEEQVRKQVMNEIAKRYSISVEEVKKIKSEFGMEKEDNQSGVEDSENENNRSGVEDSENENNQSEVSEENNSQSGVENSEDNNTQD